MPLRGSAGQLRLELTLALALVLAHGACAVAQPSTTIRALAPPLEGQWVRARSGDTAAVLARRHGVALEDLEELNGIDHRDPLPTDRPLFIPNARTAKLATTRVIAPASAPATSPRRAAPASRPRFAWPVDGLVTSGFGRRDGRMHEGIDIAARAGTPVRAAAPGLVMYAGSGVKGYGNLLLVRHAHGMVTVYAHNRRFHVAQGQSVLQGQTIAEVGNTGRARGYHLHFEVRIGEVPQDPLRYLPQRALDQRRTP